MPLPSGFKGGDINDQRVVLSGSQLLDLDTGQIVDVNGNAAIDPVSTFFSTIEQWMVLFPLLSSNCRS